MENMVTAFYEHLEQQGLSQGVIEYNGKEFPFPGEVQEPSEQPIPPKKPRVEAYGVTEFFKDQKRKMRAELKLKLLEVIKYIFLFLLVVVIITAIIFAGVWAYDSLMESQYFNSVKKAKGALEIGNFQLARDDLKKAKKYLGKMSGENRGLARQLEDLKDRIDAEASKRGRDAKETEKKINAFYRKGEYTTALELANEKKPDFRYMDYGKKLAAWVKRLERAGEEQKDRDYETNFPRAKEVYKQRKCGDLPCYREVLEIALKARNARKTDEVVAFIGEVQRARDADYEKYLNQAKARKQLRDYTQARELLEIAKNIKETGEIIRMIREVTVLERGAEEKKRLTRMLDRARRYFNQCNAKTAWSIIRDAKKYHARAKIYKDNRELKELEEKLSPVRVDFKTDRDAGTVVFRPVPSGKFSFTHVSEDIFLFNVKTSDAVPRTNDVIKAIEKKKGYEVVPIPLNFKQNNGCIKQQKDRLYILPHKVQSRLLLNGEIDSDMNRLLGGSNCWLKIGLKINK